MAGCSCPQWSDRPRANRPERLRRFLLVLYGRATLGVAATARSRLFPGERPRRVVLLPAHRAAWHPPPGRPLGLGQDHRQSAARRRGRQAATERGALHGVLALSAPGMARAVRRLAAYTIVEGDPTT